VSGALWWVLPTVAFEMRPTRSVGTFSERLMPVPVHGDDQPCCWGIWVEVSEAHFKLTWDLWDDPNQGMVAPFPGQLANTVPTYQPTIGLPGLVQLVSPESRPRFTLSPTLMHPLAVEQRDGVYPERVIEWLTNQLHA
jgi:hypothetical protein